MKPLDHCPECGAVLEEHKGKVRSVVQLRRFFKVIKLIFDHWPESHEFQPSCVEELRAYLQMKAGHREICARIPLAGMRKEAAMIVVESALRASGSYAMTRLSGNDLVVFKPKSIAFRNLGHQAFCALNDEIERAIEDETGIKVDDLLVWSKNAA